MPGRSLRVAVRLPRPDGFTDALSDPEDLARAVIVDWQSEDGEAILPFSEATLDYLLGTEPGFLDWFAAAYWVNAARSETRGAEALAALLAPAPSPESPR